MSAAEGASLSTRTIQAGIWTVGARLSSRLIDFAVLLVLARLLGPADFGLVATAMTVIYIVEAVLELPLTFVLVRQPEVTDRMYSTAFTLGLIRGLLVAGLMAGLSWPLASLYGDPRLMPLICTLALAPAARGMISPRMVIFEKAMDFRRKGILELLGKGVAGAVAISIAVSTGNYWAVAAGTVSTPVVMMGVSYVMAPMRPRLSLAEWSLFSRMTGWNFVSQVVSALNWQVDRLILPLYIDVTSFGRFTTANDIAALPFQAIVQPTAVPLFSALVNAREKGNLVGAYLKACSGIVMLMAPVMCFMALMAGPVVHILLGPAWSGGAPILAGVALTSLFVLPTVPMAALMLVLDRPRLVALRSFVELAVRVPLTVAGIILAGIPGAIAAKAGAGVALLLVTLLSVKAIAGIPFRDQLRSSLHPMVALVPAVVFLYGVPDLTQYGPYLYPAIAVVGLVYGAIYVASLYGLWWVSGRPAGLEAYVAERAAAYFRR
ncbi:oligosaccharide flippase family protein [Shinella sp. BYT-45]|uniref:oligosaccharide flippase family protein n=1 Tax=Shinella sp. BYT-45 TaxID=3377377 RepID=UPI003980FE14